MIAIGTGVIADIAMPQERGKYIGAFNLTNTFGTASEPSLNRPARRVRALIIALCDAVGPVLGGVLAYTLGWRSIFWFLTILCAVALVPMLL